MGKSVKIAVTPVIETSAYSDGDRLGAVMEFKNAIRQAGNGMGGVLLDCQVIDRDDEGKSLSILFFSENPTIASADNSALSITDAIAAASFIGWATLDTADYIDIGGQKVIKAAVNCVIHNTENSTSVYGLLVAREAVTFTAATDLTVKIGVLQD